MKVPTILNRSTPPIVSLIEKSAKNPLIATMPMQNGIGECLLSQLLKYMVAVVGVRQRSVVPASVTLNSEPVTADHAFIAATTSSAARGVGCWSGFST